MDIDKWLRLKIDLLLNGVAICAETDQQTLSPEVFKVGIAEGVHLDLGDGIYVTASIRDGSPFFLKKNESDQFILKSNTHELPVRILPDVTFSLVYTSRGTKMIDVGSMQPDRLRISAFGGCSFAMRGKECAFCELGQQQLPCPNNLNDIHELITYAEKHEPRLRHYLVSGGTPPDNQWNHYLNVCKKVRELSSKKIYAMLSPPPNLSFINSVVDAGINEIGINMEFYDRKLSKLLMPGKASVDADIYYKNLEHAVNLLGAEGAVRSILIVGLEPVENTVQGVKELASRGIMPILSIFKPLKNTALANHPSPSKDLLIDAWERAQSICEHYSLTLGPLCKCCLNNTLSLPVNDKYMMY